MATADNFQPGWTDDRVKILERLWREGVSGGLIAKQLGGVTRNAVIGKAYRLGLPPRDTEHRAERFKREAAPRLLSRERIARIRTPRQPKPRIERIIVPPKPKITTNHPCFDVASPSRYQPPRLKAERAMADVAAAKVRDFIAHVDEIGRKFLRGETVRLGDAKSHHCRWVVGEPDGDNTQICGRQKARGCSYCDGHAGIALRPALPGRR